MPKINVLKAVLDYPDDSGKQEALKRPDGSGKLVTFRYAAVVALNAPGLQTDKGRAFELSLAVSTEEMVDLDKDSWDFILDALDQTNTPPVWRGRLAQEIASGGADLADHDAD